MLYVIQIGHDRKQQTRQTQIGSERASEYSEPEWLGGMMKQEPGIRKSLRETLNVRELKYNGEKAPSLSHTHIYMIDKMKYTNMSTQLRINFSIYINCILDERPCKWKRRRKRDKESKTKLNEKQTEAKR